MILVDTIVWSEPLRQAPDPAVVGWIRDHHTTLVMCTVTAHELRYGVDRMPQGARKALLEPQLAQLLGEMEPRMLPYDLAAAGAHAEIRIQAERSGRGLSNADGQILGIAVARGTKIATRNAGDFAGFGVEIIDPWEYRLMS